MFPPSRTAFLRLCVICPCRLSPPSRAGDVSWAGIFISCELQLVWLELLHVESCKAFAQGARGLFSVAVLVLSLSFSPQNFSSRPPLHPCDLLFSILLESRMPAHLTLFFSTNITQAISIWSSPWDFLLFGGFFSMGLSREENSLFFLYMSIHWIRFSCLSRYQFTPLSWWKGSRGLQGPKNQRALKLLQFPCIWFASPPSSGISTAALKITPYPSLSKGKIKYKTGLF